MKLIQKFLLFLDILLIIGTLLLIYAWRMEPRWVEWTYVDMPITNLPDNLIGKQLIQISDIHVGEQVDDDFIIAVFKKINTLKPDFVLYTGDFISTSETHVSPYSQLEHILKNKAQGTLGTLAIFGNHDYGILARNTQTADSLDRILTNNKITILRNQAIDIAGLNFIGVDEYWSSRFDITAALKHYKPNTPTIVLCHNPDVVDLKPYWDKYEGWILSGHTHGGQVRLPYCKPFLIPVENKNYDYGLKKIDDNKNLYINRGLGHAIRIRFNVRPEVTIFTLKKAL